MDNETEVRDFLTNRRGRLAPEQVGLIGGGRRRVPGLRREEVALLAGVSSDYYVRIERGSLAGVSPEILDAIAGALQLSDAETEHLHDLARAAAPAPIRRRTRTAEPTVRPSVQWMLDAITAAPAWVLNPRKDTLAINALGRALLGPMLDDPATQGNGARFLFLSPASRLFYPDWERSADSTVASMRIAAGQNPHDKGLTDLIGELVTRSDAFRHRWAKHDVRHHRTGPKRIVHPEVGELEFTFEGMDLPGTPGWSLFVFTAEPGSATEERLTLLGTLAASHDTVAASAPTAASMTTKEAS
ncbi:helix-turn-helix domain-containing protein [Leifsonia sp. NPDC058194]|uniref:helix-turn-helix domain-containing protein n=1 Tax=Leifsonia sp. NPDC058194 TaxID=3346374 RepID=UPI0036DB3C46